VTKALFIGLMGPSPICCHIWVSPLQQKIEVKKLAGCSTCNAENSMWSTELEISISTWKTI